MSARGSIGLALLLTALSGCEDKAKQPAVTRSRSQSVVAKPGAKPTAAATTQNTAPKPTGKLAKRKTTKLCGGALKPGYPAPSLKVPTAGKAPNSELIPSGKWVWVNFWAAWCEPCKEEIPRLLKWQSQLSSSKTPMVVSFITLDDDERQLNAFLKSQPASGLQGTYWLKEGDPRAEWLKAAKLDEDPSLPLHLLVDPKGAIRCVIDGAVESSDFEQVKALLSQG